MEFIRVYLYLYSKRENVSFWRFLPITTVFQHTPLDFDIRKLKLNSKHLCLHFFFFFKCILEKGDSEMQLQLHSPQECSYSNLRHILNSLAKYILIFVFNWQSYMCDSGNANGIARSFIFGVVVWGRESAFTKRWFPITF